jgi:hypothetical protein
MRTPLNPVEQEAKWISDKESKTDRLTRLRELKSKIRELEAARNNVKVISPNAKVLFELWTSSLNDLAAQFVSDLKYRASNGKTPQINFNTPGAMAFLARHQCQSALQELAEMVAGTQGVSDADRNLQYRAIDDELNKAKVEYGSLGGH